MATRIPGVDMENEKAEPPATPSGRGKDQTSILGLSTNELAGLSADELTGNPTAIRMVLHYYAQLVEENNNLRNETNTLKTYVTAYDNKKSNSAAGAILLALSNVSVGFGVNLLTIEQIWAGAASLVAGLGMVAGGIYFSFLKDKG
jgi:hypothetical protein